MSDSQLEILSNETEERMEFCPEYMNHHNTDMLILQQCLLQLKPQYREVLILYFFVQLNNQEIADMLDCPLGTVKSRLLYGKKYLKEAIEKYEKDNDIKLSFRASSIEALLATACLSLAPASHSIWLSVPKFMISYALPYIKLATVILLCGSTLFGGYRLLDAYHSNHGMVDDKALFSELYYENIQVTTPREAYEILFNNAHCTEDIQKLNQKQLNQLTDIYAALKQYGGSYYDLLYTYYWDMPFEELVESSKPQF